MLHGITLGIIRVLGIPAYEKILHGITLGIIRVLGIPGYDKNVLLDYFKDY